MAFTHGKDSVFWIDNAAGSLVDLTAYTDSIEGPSRTVDMGETTTMGKEAKTFIGGLTDATFTVSGKFDSTATVGPDVILASLVGLETTSTFEIGPEGGVGTKVKYSGECFLTAYATSAPVGDVVSWSASFQVTGEIARGTFT